MYNLNNKAYKYKFEKISVNADKISAKNNTTQRGRDIFWRNQGSICDETRGVSTKLLTAAFTSYVRPLLEYASPVWSPHLIKDIDAIEKVQRRFTKSFPNLRDLPYPIRIARLNIVPLGDRRSNIDLITSYRILNNLVHHTSFQILYSTHSQPHSWSLINSF